MLQKKYIRNFFLRIRKNLSEEEVNCYSEMIFTVLKEENFLSYKSYHIFIPIVENKEVNTHFILHYLLKNKKKMYVPKIVNNDIVSIEWNETTELVKNKWNIFEPYSTENQCKKTFDVIFIPMLACDKHGNRIGYGKGFYDRFLATQPFAKKIGLCFFDELNDVFETNAFDIKLDYLATPLRIVSFTENEVK